MKEQIFRFIKIALISIASIFGSILLFSVIVVSCVMYEQNHPKKAKPIAPVATNPDDAKVYKTDTDEPAPVKDVLMIPGIAAVDVYSNFVNKGYDLKKNLGSNPYWICEKQIDADMLSVTAYGKNASNIFKVEGITTQGNMEFLAYLASLPYTGHSPNAAQWVRDHPDGGKTVFGGVTFNLYKGNQKTMVLEMFVE